MDIMNAFRTVTTALKEWADKNKVQKVDGKGLSSNDYTDEEKDKLFEVEEGANRTVVDDYLSPSSTNPVQNKVVYEEISRLSDAFQNMGGSESSGNTLQLNTSGVLPKSASWISVAYGSGKFVAISRNSSIIAYSTDGMEWTQTQLPVSTDWANITYGGGYFVAVAKNSTSCVYSTDGVSWTKRTMPSNKKWSSIAYGNGIFVAIAPDNVCAYGPITGTLQLGTLPTSANWRVITFNGTNFIAASDNYATIAISANGSSWSTSSYYSIYEGIEDMAVSDSGACVAIGVQASDQFYYSADGLNWTESYVPHGIWKTVAYGNGKFVALERGSARAMYSSDGITWNNITLPVAEQWTDVVYGDGLFIAVANKSNVVAYSKNGISWSSKKLELIDSNNNTITSELGLSLAGWTQIYDSGFVPEKVNAFSGINVSGYKHLLVAIRSVNITDSAGGISGAIIFEGDNGQEYAFNNIMPNLIQNTSSTSGGMAIFKITNGFIICENAMRAISAETMLCDVNGFGADNLTPVGGGILKCTNSIVNMMVTNAALSSKYYYGADSRVVVWGCKV